MVKAEESNKVTYASRPFGLKERVEGIVYPIIPVYITEEYDYQRTRRLSDIG